MLQKRDMYFPFLADPLILLLTLSADSEIQGRVVVCMAGGWVPRQNGAREIAYFLLSPA